ncbi:MAG TPA: hypothetical protein EYN73_00675 [Chromatiaceae bacterium]|jgi:hypothetical protein|nr:hypothetical protein [Chromatiaceae bacterium]HIA07606.1 hypothetical protein [Chromatiaceae bacterium]HIN82934.1 hypothetical protein [Chromatiales bacterium]
MKNYLFGLLLLPGLLGLLVIYHTMIDYKSNGTGGELTNRIARLELVWLAMNKPHLFRSVLPGVALNVEERHRILASSDDAALLGTRIPPHQ